LIVPLAAEPLLLPELELEEEALPLEAGLELLLLLLLLLEPQAARASDASAVTATANVRLGFKVRLPFRRCARSVCLAHRRVVNLL
jgi:hypothetical protein